MELLIGPAIAALVAVTLWFLNSRRALKPETRWTRDDEQGYEAVEVRALVRRRPVEVHAVGLLVRWGPPWQRRRYVVEGATRQDLPHTFTDGQLISTGFELSDLIDRLYFGVGDKVRVRAVVRPFVETSVKTYVGRVDASGPLNLARSGSRTGCVSPTGSRRADRPTDHAHRPGATGADRVRR